MDIDVIWKYSFPALTIRCLHVKGINNWCSSLEGSSSYVLWNTDRKHESCSNAKLIQTKWNGVAEASGMKGPEGKRSNLSPAHVLSRSLWERRGFVQRGCLLRELEQPKAELVGTPFHSEELNTWRGNLCNGQVFKWLSLTSWGTGTWVESLACIHGRHRCGSHPSSTSGLAPDVQNWK